MTRGPGTGGDNPGGGIIMRGIPPNVSLGGASISLVPPTAAYTDGIYGGIGGDYDLGRVEVLRGPQGTLYGRSATAGLVARYSNDPKLGEMGGNVSLEGGNYNLINGSVAFNLPLGETIAIRMSGMHYNRDGFYAKRGGKQAQNAARVKVLYKPSEQLSLLLGAAFQDNKTYNGEYGLMDGAGYLQPPFPIG